MIFHDRIAAARALADALASYKNQDVIVLALPRGGVVLGAVIAEALSAPLDVVVARKLGMPGNDEYAIGALTEDGEPMMNPEAVGAVPKEELKKLIVKKRLEIKARLAKYRAGQAAWPIKNKIAIIVDDGVATGMTMSAALKSVRAREPKKIVLAVPHGVAESMERLKKTSDEVITFSPPPFYSAVAQSYEEFPQVEDEEVIRILKNSRQIKNR